MIIELTEHDIGMIRGAIDLAIKAGGLAIARQLLPLDDKIVTQIESQQASKGNGSDDRPAL